MLAHRNPIKESVLQIGKHCAYKNALYNYSPENLKANFYCFKVILYFLIYRTTNFIGLKTTITINSLMFLEIKQFIVNSRICVTWFLCFHLSQWYISVMSFICIIWNTIFVFSRLSICLLYLKVKFVCCSVCNFLP
jgi:hypothetical protein